MELDIKSANNFADCLIEQNLLLSTAQERLERACKFFEKNEESDEAIRARMLFDALCENIAMVNKLVRAVRRISSNYSGCEKRIEERYDSLWHIEKSNIPALLDLSAMGENMKDISFV